MTRSFAAILLLLGSVPPIARAAQPPRAAELLERSIRYHDPEGLWMNTAHRLNLEETRPNGPARRTTLVIDNREGRFEMTRETDGTPKIELRIEGEVVEAKLDGSPEFSIVDAEKYRLTPEAAKRTRNYYTFLYGLPVKLRDPGTRLDPEARRTKFQGKDVLALRVTYDETVGGDIWYFYLDPDSCELVGYRFYHDESKNDGEYITLEDEAQAGAIRLPRVRTWYTNDESKLLGTDTIETIDVETPSEFAELATGYIEAWKRFYPSRAYSRGFLPSIHGIENYSAVAIQAWIDLNRQILREINEASGHLTRDEALDARLIGAKIRSELEKWERDRPHETSPALYADPIAHAIPRVAESPLLSPEEKIRTIRGQLEGIDALTAAAEQTLRDGQKQAMGESLERLETAAVYLERDLSEVARSWLGNGPWKELTRKCQDTSIRVRQLARHVREHLLPRATLPADPILGRDNFTRKLKLYTDSNLTPGELEAMALDEIEDSKHAIHALSAAYLQEMYPHLELPSDFNSLVARAFEDLENNRPSGEQEYLQKLRQFGQEAEDFVREHEIATLPERRTLSIELAPESSGPMARIGYVRSAPPFHPNPWTVWYLATIPDSHAEEEREEF